MFVGASVVFGKSTTGIAIFNHSVGARQLGMADSVVGIADDANAIYYNPAGLATVKDLELNAMYFDNIVDTQDETLSVVKPLSRGLLGNKAGLGLGIKAYQGGDIEVIEGTFANDIFTMTSERTLNAESDYMVSVAYAEEIMPKVFCGLALKGIRSVLVEDYSASAYAMDAGALYRTPLKGLSIGLSLLNYGKELKFIEEGDALPQRTVVGAGYDMQILKSATMKVGYDYLKEREEDATNSMGIELTLLDMIMVRSGYYLNSDLGSMTAGIGIKIGWLQMDYGYGLMDELGNLQKASMTMRWGGSEKELTKKETPKNQKTTKKTVKTNNTTKNTTKKYSLAK